MPTCRRRRSRSWAAPSATSPASALTPRPRPAATAAAAIIWPAISTASSSSSWSCGRKRRIAASPPTISRFPSSNGWPADSKRDVVVPGPSGRDRNRSGAGGRRLARGFVGRRVACHERRRNDDLVDGDETGEQARQIILERVVGCVGVAPHFYAGVRPPCRPRGGDDVIGHEAKRPRHLELFGNEIVVDEATH